jgi:hypothetical protein
MSDYTTGHAHRTIGAKYGAPTIGHMAAALEKFPRYRIAAAASASATLSPRQPTMTDSRPIAEGG